MLLLLLGIPFLEFQGFAGFPLSAEKFPRWSFWVGRPGWQFFPFLCVRNQTLGGVSWVGHPGSLASTWWTFSERRNYLSRNCWRLSSSPRLTWVEFRGWKFFVSCRWSAGYLGGVSWMEVPCGSPSQNSLEFNEVAGFPLSAEKFRRWSFLGGTSWLAILSFCCFGNQILGAIFWVGHPGSLAST